MPTQRRQGSNPPPIMAVSTSLKAAHSASRALLQLAVECVAPIYPSIDLLDLSAHDLPMFAGSDPRTSVTLTPLLQRVTDCGGLLLSVPCYWRGVSGVFKNFVDVLCGPAYDLESQTTVFSGKPVALIVVGADAASARDGRADAERVLGAVGAELVGETVVVTEPRTVPIPASTPGDVTRLAALLARAALVGGSRDDA